VTARRPIGNTQIHPVVAMDRWRNAPMALITSVPSAQLDRVDTWHLNAFDDTFGLAAASSSFPGRPNMRKRTALLILLISAVVAVPVALVGTFMLWRFWDWFENKTRIESLGHSGPANWCFVAVYVLLISAVLIGLWVGLWKRRGPTD
jgi:hypothetical protein